MSACGNLTILAVRDLADLGPAEGLPVEIRWKWYYGVPGLLLWTALVLALVLTKANRKAQALLILIPLAISNVVWLAFKKISGMGSADAELFDMLFQSLTIGLAILWLLAHKLAAWSALLRFLLAAFVMIAIAVLGAVSFGLTLSDQGATALAFLIGIVFSVLVGLVLARWCCPKRLAAGRFMGWLALWTVIGSTATMYVAFLSWSAITSRWPSDIVDAVMQVAITGVVAGVIVYVLILPYMVLGFASGFFRERFQACFGIHPISQMDDTTLRGQQEEPQAPDRESVP